MKRLLRISRRMVEAKARFDPVSADALQDFTQFAPPAVAAQAMRLLSRLRIADRVNPPVNVVISNVPGPNHRAVLGWRGAQALLSRSARSATASAST